VRSGTGGGRQGPGLLGAMGRPVVLPAAPAPVSGRASAVPPAAGVDPGTAGARPQNEVLPEQQRVDSRQGCWPPQAPAVERRVRLPGERGSLDDELSAQLDELDERKQAGLLTGEEFARQRAWLLGT
jgi:hypothetical protein